MAEGSTMTTAGSIQTPKVLASAVLCSRPAQLER